jgi:hypothetical protein
MSAIDKQAYASQMLAKEKVKINAIYNVFRSN